jgi:hypothetical protein
VTNPTPQASSLLSTRTGSRPYQSANRPKKKLLTIAPSQNMAWAKLARQSSSQSQLLFNKRKNRSKLKFEVEVEILLTGNHYKQTAVWFLFSTTLFSNY